MTQKELDEKIYSYNSYILDKFKDIQGQANSLKNVDKPKNEVAFCKIKDFIADIRKAYDELEKLAVTSVEEEVKEDDGYNSFISNSHRTNRF